MLQARNPIMLAGGYFLLLPDSYPSLTKVMVYIWPLGHLSGRSPHSWLKRRKTQFLRIHHRIQISNCQDAMGRLLFWLRPLPYKSKTSRLTQRIGSITICRGNRSKTALKSWFTPKGASSEGRAFPRAWKRHHKAAHVTWGPSYLPSPQSWGWGQLQMVVSPRD